MTSRGTGRRVRTLRRDDRGVSPVRRVSDVRNSRSARGRYQEGLRAGRVSRLLFLASPVQRHVERPTAGGSTAYWSKRAFIEPHEVVSVGTGE